MAIYINQYASAIEQKHISIRGNVCFDAVDCVCTFGMRKCIFMSFLVFFCLKHHDLYNDF